VQTMKLVPSININLLFTIIVILFLGYYSYLSYQRIGRLNKEADLVSDTYIVKLKLEQTITYQQDAGSAQRGYILTKDPSFLHNFNAAIEKTNKIVAEINSLTTDNPEQQQNVKTLKALISDRYKLLGFLLVMKNSVSSAALAAKSQIEDKNKMDAMRAQIASMVKLEDSLLVEREKAKKDLSSTTPLYSLILSFVSLLIIFFAFNRIKNNVKKEKKLREELSYSKSFLQNILNSSPNGIGCYDAIRNTAGKITDFRMRYINGEITRIYGLIPGDIIGKTLSEIFPHYYKNGSFEHFCDCVENGNHVEYETENTYNNIRAWIHIELEKLYDGVTITFRDITEEKKEALLKLYEYNKTLEKANSEIKKANSEIKKTNEALITANKKLEYSNKEFERSNEELTSFTYVASHDLQEPLRKIRMFISRILTEQLSENSKELFTRIISSAGRMNDLIEALFSYSRVNTTAIIKEETDLSNVVEEVKNSLHHIIEEKNAVVEISPLPKIKVVRLQFLQLFTNIIENGIKYSKLNIAPLIQISAEIVNGETIYRAGADVKTNYWKLSIADNGIGFDQEYENKMFEIFQRLHGKAEYTGTGIGLAICKKVIHNHNGFITATGKPGIGSTFNIFLPVN
jgi:signal transduction histidine kinase/CHASE3 domain sensor protein